VCSRLNLYVSLLMSRSARDCSTFSNILHLLIGCMKLLAQVYSRYTLSYLKRQVFSMITFRLNVLIFCNSTPMIKMSDRNVSTLKIYVIRYKEVFFQPLDVCDE
jgi:hypothetical protein